MVIEFLLALGAMDEKPLITKPIKKIATSAIIASGLRFIHSSRKTHTNQKSSTAFKIFH